MAREFWRTIEALRLQEERGRMAQARQDALIQEDRDRQAMEDMRQAQQDVEASRGQAFDRNLKAAETYGKLAALKGENTPEFEGPAGYGQAADIGYEGGMADLARQQAEWEQKQALKNADLQRMLMQQGLIGERFELGQQGAMERAQLQAGVRQSEGSKNRAQREDLFEQAEFGRNTRAWQSWTAAQDRLKQAEERMKTSGRMPDHLKYALEPMRQNMLNLRAELGKIPQFDAAGREAVIGKLEQATQAYVAALTPYASQDHNALEALKIIGELMSEEAPETSGVVGPTGAQEVGDEWGGIIP